MDDKSFDLINRYLTTEGLVKQLPAKQSIRKKILVYLSSKFENDTIYSEKEVNTILQQWHSFSDPELLRRELCVYGLLMRKKDGSEYWRVT
jgi:hypothetical protein